MAFMDGKCNDLRGMDLVGSGVSIFMSGYLHIYCTLAIFEARIIKNK
jgi:hypothetical protein